MSDVLERILADKRKHVARRMAERPFDEIRDMARAAPPPRGFAKALALGVERTGLALICEIKKASPSKGLIRSDFDPASLARAYAEGGASCLSVLTDTPYFQGRDADLAAAREAVSLPVLRKDFIIDPYQIAESRAIGADCILLIMAALSDTQARALEDLAAGLGMDVLAEVHDELELERALTVLRTPLIGVNNRNLKTLEIDLATTERLAPKLPDDRVLIAESGLHTPKDLARMMHAGARRFLIGESLMRQADVAEATRTLMAAVPAKGLTHFDEGGKARMVDVSDKAESERTAVARGRVLVSPETMEVIQAGTAGKGDVLGVARLAGIMAAKRTADLVPLCHPLPLTSVTLDLACLAEVNAVEITATCRTTGRTGVEMEALTAVSVAALTVYDMCKAKDRGMRLTDIRLVHKSGGKSGSFDAP